MKRHLLSLLALVTFAGPAFAKRTTTNPTFLARAAMQDQIEKDTGKRPTGKAVHAHRVGSLAYDNRGDSWDDKRNPKFDYHQVMVWQGKERGPGGNRKNWKGPFGVRLAAVPTKEGLSVEQRVQGTKLSKDLTALGLAKVEAHLAAKGLEAKEIRFGDFAKPLFNQYRGTSGKNRLSQKPISRESGNLRYTVDFKDGTTRRFLVKTNGRRLVSGKGSVLGKVVGDMDYYRE